MLAWIELTLIVVTGLLLICVIGPNVAHIMSRNTLFIIHGFLVICIVFVFAYIDFSLNVTKKPIVSTRAKVMSKQHLGSKQSGVYSSYRVVFLVDNKIELELGVSKKQYKAIEKNDIVDLVYQGIISRSIQKLPNGVVILNEDHPQKEPKAK